MKFIFNNDLTNPHWDFHNTGHVVGNFLLTLILSIWLSGYWAAALSYGLWFTWEIGDGFKPWYTEYTKYYTSNMVEYFRRELLFSNGFSMQDVCIWNPAGVLLALLVLMLI